MSKQSAHDAYEALKIKAPQRCAQLGISRDKVLLRFDQWAEGAMRTITYGPFGDTKEIPAIDVRIKANTELAKIMNCYERTEGDPAGRGPGTIVVNLGFLDPARAEAILARITKRSSSGSGPRVLDVTSDVAPGEPDVPATS